MKTANVNIPKDKENRLSLKNDLVKDSSKCYYNNFSCEFASLQTATFDMNCESCEHYHNGVRATGAMPILNDLFQFIKDIRKHSIS